MTGIMLTNRTTLTVTIGIITFNINISHNDYLLYCRDIFMCRNKSYYLPLRDRLNTKTKKKNRYST